MKKRIAEVAEQKQRSSKSGMVLKKTKSTATSYLNPIKVSNPKPLPTHECIVPPMPKNLLPLVAQRVVDHVSAITQTPPEFAVTTLFVVLSCALSNRYVIVTDNTQPSNFISGNLSGLVCAASGSNKSGAIHSIMEVLSKLQISINKTYDENLAELQAEAHVQKIQKQGEKKKADALLNKATEIKETDPVQSNELIKLAKALLKDNQGDSHPPKAKVVICNDATEMALAKHFSKQTYPIMLYRDEFSNVLKSIFDPKADALRTFVLEAADGLRDFSIERFSEHHSFKMIAPKLSIFGSTQPSVMAKLVQQIKENKLPDDGLLYRLQIFVMPDVAENPKHNSDAYDDHLSLQQIHNFIQQLDDGEYLAKINNDERIKVFMDEGGQEAYREFITRLNQGTTNSKYSEYLISHLKKYRSMVPSIALVIAAIRQFEENHFVVKPLAPISHQDITMAVKWASFLFQHTKKLWQDPDERLANAKLLLSRMNELDDTFTTSQVMKKGWKRLNTNIETVENALTYLMDYGYLTRHDAIHPSGGRPSKPWVKHSSIAKDTKGKASS